MSFSGTDPLAEMNELDRFWMCIPEQFLMIDVIIPKTNKHLGTPAALQEFYVWLGCIFYMGVFSRHWQSQRMVVVESDQPLQGGSVPTEWIHVEGAIH
jgi:hypothetical protein